MTDKPLHEKKISELIASFEEFKGHTIYSGDTIINVLKQWTIAIVKNYIEVNKIKIIKIYANHDSDIAPIGKQELQAFAFHGGFVSAFIIKFEITEEDLK